ncbi:MAG: Uncharacterized protein G01um101417_214 [Parcubacteria group bacterium Gr01-1014_17]|nr:MAG: Uncharacterized protein G01um101417_214 [Parcubacteria group bacterium Gr01-1014_17]
MTQIILIIIGIVVIVLLLSRRTREQVVGICASAIETASQKQARKQKILSLFQDKRELSNTEIRAALGVSPRTAVRYLDELEREGKVEQVGKVGHYVTYRLL